jgi:hypothetical protein
MGRTKGDTAEKFPWDRYLSEDDEYFEDAISQCVSTHMNSSMVRKAVSTIGISDVSGTKIENCAKINKEMTVLRSRLLKILSPELRDKTRKELVDHFRAKLISKDQQINIPIPDKPVLPSLSRIEIEEIEKRYPGVISPGVKAGSKPTSPAIKPKVVFEEPDEISLEESSEVDISDEILLEAFGVLYYYNSPVENGKRKLSKNAFKSQLFEKYKDKISDTSILFNDTIITSKLKNVISDMSSISAKLSNDRVILAKTIIDKYDKKIGLRDRPKISPRPRPNIPIIPVERAEREKSPSVSPRPTIPIIPVERAEREKSPSVSPRKKGKYSNEDFMNIIRSKGWIVPDTDNKDELCDYVLDNVKREADIIGKEEEVIDRHISILEEKLQKTMEKYEERILNLEKYIEYIKKPSSEKVVKEEKAIEELKEKINEIKEKIEIAQKEKEKVEEEKVETRKACFIMNNWLDQKDFKFEIAKNSVYCDDNMSCNLDRKLCEQNVSDDLFISDINGNKFHSQDKILIDMITEKINKKKKEIELAKTIRPILRKKDDRGVDIKQPTIKKVIFETDSDTEEEIKLPSRPVLKKKPKPVPQKIEFDIETEEEVEVPPRPVLKKKPKPVPQKIEFDIETEEEVEEPSLLSPVVSEPSVELEEKFEKIMKEQIEEQKKIDDEFYKKISEVKTADEIPSVMEIIKPLIKEEKQIISKECFTKDSYNTYQSMIDDLSCPNGEVCDLNAKRCVQVTDKDIVVPITIGDMIISIKGSNNIVEALKQKIRALQPKEEVIEVEEKVIMKEKPLISQKNPTLEEIIESMKNISGSRNVTTSNQQKVKALEKKALDKLRKCAGI